MGHRWYLLCCSGFWGPVFFLLARRLLPSLAETLADGSRMQISLGFSWAAIVGAIVSPALGKYMDQGSPKRVILLGITLISVSYFLLGAAQTLWHFYLVIGSALA